MKLFVLIKTENRTWNFKSKRKYKSFIKEILKTKDEICLATNLQLKRNLNINGQSRQFYLIKTLKVEKKLRLNQKINVM